MFHSFIKNSSKQILFTLFFLTLGCSSNVKESILYEINKVHCFSSYQKHFTNEFITTNDEIFASTIAELKKHENIEDEYNLIVTAGPKISSGHYMFFNKAVLKNDLLSLYFDITEPQIGSIELTVATYPICVLNIENINEYEFKISIQ